MKELPNECEKCGEEACGYSDDGDLLCQDCLFEFLCWDMFGDDD